MNPTLKTGVQRSDFSRVLMDGKDPTKVGTLNTCEIKSLLRQAHRLRRSYSHGMIQAFGQWFKSSPQPGLIVAQRFN